MSNLIDLSKMSVDDINTLLAEATKVVADKQTAERFITVQNDLLKSVKDCNDLNDLKTVLMDCLKEISPKSIGKIKGKTVTSAPAAPAGGVAKLIGDLTKAGESPEFIAVEVGKSYPDAKTANNVSYVKQYIQKYGFTAPAPAK